MGEVQIQLHYDQILKFIALDTDILILLKNDHYKWD